MSECREAFEAWWDCAGSSRAYGFDKDRQFVAWQAAWNRCPTEHMPVTVPTVEEISDVIHESLLPKSPSDDVSSLIGVKVGSFAKCAEAIHALLTSRTEHMPVTVPTVEEIQDAICKGFGVFCRRGPDDGDKTESLFEAEAVFALLTSRTEGR